jgi:hypothetical protein
MSVTEKAASVASAEEQLRQEQAAVDGENPST